MRAPAPSPVADDATSSTSVLRSAVLSTWGIGVQGLSRLAYTVVIGAAFGTEALGHASALLSLSIFAALLWPTAAGNTASRFMALALRGRVDERLLARSLGLSVLVSSLALGAASVPVAIALGNELPLALSAAWLVIGYGAYAYTRGARLGSHRAGQVAVWDTVSSATALGLLVAVTVSGRGLLVLVPLAIGYTVFAVACWPRPRRGDADAPDVSRDALGFAAWNVLAGVTTNGLLQLAMITAQIVEPGIRAGVYAAAFTLATPASMLGQAVSQVVVPAFAHRSGGATLRDRGPRSLLLVFAGAAAVLFGLVAWLAPWYLPVFYPGEGVEAVPLLRFLMLGVYVFSVGLIPAALLLATGRSRAVALASVAGFVVGLATMAASAPFAGVQAGSLGFLVGSAINLVATIVLACRPASAGAAPEVVAGVGDDVPGTVPPAEQAGDEPR
jgi:O-antigen/teichoic acid export membrane protein